MKKIIFLVMSSCLILLVLSNGISVSMANAEDNMEYIRGTIFVNGVEIGAEDTILIGSTFAQERTIDNILIETDTIVEHMLFPFRTVLEALGSEVILKESTGNIYFDYAEIEYVCKLRDVQRNGYPTLCFIQICEVKNKESINNEDYIQLNPMSADGSYCKINDIIYLNQQTGQRLLEALGCAVEIDLEKRILNIYRSDGISITLNGTPIQPDIAPIIENGRTLIPLRTIFEALCATVEWNDSTQTVTAKKDEISVSLQIGNNEMAKNGKIIPLDIQPRLVGGRTLVPIRAVAESFGAVVEWDEDTKTVKLNKKHMHRKFRGAYAFLLY